MTKEELFYLVTTKPNGNIEEKLFKRKFPEYYQEVNNLNFPSDFSWTQKLYHYFNDDLELKLGLCPVCGKRCKFASINIGYRHHCSKECKCKDNAVTEKMRITNNIRYGVDYQGQRPEAVEKMKDTCQERYGADSFSKTDMFKQKISDFYQEKYGVDNYMETEEFRQKSKDTCQKNWGVDNYAQTEEFRQKSIETCRKNWGVDSYSQTEECKEKAKDTNRKRYGVDNPMQCDEIKERFKNKCQEKWGVDNPFQVKEHQEKQKDTCRKIYGVDCVFQSEKIKQKSIETCRKNWGVDNSMQCDEIKQKSRNTCQDKWGVDYYTQTEEYKIRNYNTKLKNHSFSTSKIEEELYNWFIENNISVLRQYRSDLYPFVCDFYLVDYDLYIEIQGSWTHGHHPFDENNPEDVNKLNEWKSKNTHYYNNAIETWSERDVLKRNTAKENNLNFLEIFSFNFNEVIEIVKMRIHK